MKKMLCFVPLFFSVLLYMGCGGESGNVSNNVNPESIITYNMVFGGSSCDSVYVMQQTNDGGCIIMNPDFQTTE